MSLKMKKIDSNSFVYIETPDFSLSTLQERFNLEPPLEPLYRRYEQRAQLRSFTTFLSVQVVISLFYLIFTIIGCQEGGKWICSTDSSLILISQSIIIGLCSLILWILQYRDLIIMQPWILLAASISIAITFEILDAAILIQHHFSSVEESSSFVVFSPFSTTKVPILTHYNHIIIYLFLPIQIKSMVFIMGLSTSAFGLALYSILEFNHNLLNSEDILIQVFVDAIYYMSLNFVGFFVRYVGEINLRRGFMDKRTCIETTCKLRYEKEQEENLLKSIIPNHIAKKVRNRLWNYVENERKNDEAQNPFNELFIEKHDMVSILFADICNFTPLTATLSVEKLVLTLNDLFGKFDEAASSQDCMRIKILGDCYYCVSGVPTPMEAHADNCVSMGLEMIRLIADVREQHDVPVDMRIGIHSGYVLSGLIGLRKWQYDIWSKDVTIANLMESKGVGGAIHITEETRSHLKKSYDIHPVQEVFDDVPLLQGLTTYLIYPPTRTVRVRMSSGANQTRICHKNGNSGDSYQRRRSVLMDTSLKKFRKMKRSAGDIMKEEIERLPLGKADQWLHPNDINPLLLCFRDLSWEKPYLLQMDPLYKFYILASFFILNAMGFILIVSEKLPHVHLWIVYIVLFLLLVLLLPTLWISYIWDQIVDPHYESLEEDTNLEPPNPILRAFYVTSRKISGSWLMRNSIFVVVSVVIMISSVIDVATVNCIPESPKNYTYRCSLAIMVIFTFLRIQHMLKFFILSTCITFYAFIIFGPLSANSKNLFSVEYFGYDELFTFNNKNCSHFVYICVIAIFFLLMDRQHEYMRRLDYQWKRQLKSDQEQASDFKLVNKTLLQNILPYHVADVYLSNTREVGLYSEEYDTVAVMFASIPQYAEYFCKEANSFEKGEKCLQTLNDIISLFDRLLFREEFCRVEKIKIISSTYMAACGLDPGKRRSSLGISDGALNTETLVRFAAAMMKELDTFVKNNITLGQDEEFCFDFQLRTGLMMGPLTAGVVGAQKPMYDIWGDTVNVASRMDYTGVIGKVQIPEETAKLLMSVKVDETDRRNISCIPREKIPVKGKGLMMTYFVDINPETFEINTIPYSEIKRTQEKTLGPFHLLPSELSDYPSDEETLSNELTSFSSIMVEKTVDFLEEDDVISYEESMDRLRVSYKKDSGYGSQGQLLVNKAKRFNCT